MRSFNLTATTQQRYITKVRIENFQSHEDTTFELSPGINIIAGSSEAGKSALLRAINFAIHNEPRGDDFVRHERDETRVHIWWSDGCYLCRIKGVSRNAVLLKDKDGYEQGFEKIGNHLPSEALDVLGHPPIDAESGPIAYADQHMPLFLVTLSASELPRTISRLTGIDDFEDAAELLNKEANAANRKIKDSAKRIEGYENQLKQFAKLDDKLKHLGKMDGLSEQIDNISENVAAAKSLKTNYDDLMKMGKATNLALQQSSRISSLSGRISPIRDVVDNINCARSLSQNYENLKLLEQDAITYLKIGEPIIAASNIATLTSAKAIVKNVAKAKELKQQYDDLIESGRVIKKGSDTWTSTLSMLNNEKTEIVSEMRDSGLWCNVCQRPKSMDACEQ